jgi:hypothetical protein
MEDRVAKRRPDLPLPLIGFAATANGNANIRERMT